MSIPFDYILHFDGSAQPNPGRGGYGWVIKRASDGQNLMSGGDVVDIDGRTEVTSNEAEYMGLIKGLEKCFSLGFHNILIRGDSELVISHVSGTYRVTAANLIPLNARARDMTRRFGMLQFQSIPREQNAEADRIAQGFAAPPVATPPPPAPIGPPTRTRGRARGGVVPAQPPQAPQPPQPPHTSGRNRGRGERARERTPQQREGQGSSRLYYGTQWLTYLQQSSREKSPFFLSLLNVLLTVPEAYHKFPPIFPPPTVQRAEESNVQAMQALEREFSSLNLYAVLDQDDEEQANRAPAERERGRIAQGGRPLDQNPPNSQLRYLLVRVESGLVEAHRSEAEKFARDRKWAETEQAWSTAYLALNTLLIKIGDWFQYLYDARERELPLTAELHEGHRHGVLEELCGILGMLRDDTEEKKAQAWEKLNQELEKILRKLNPMRQSRDQVRERVGEDRWRNNPQPKNDYSEQIVALAKERDAIRSAMETMDSLTAANVLLE